MNILITGSSGFLGEYLMQELQSFNIVTLGRSKLNNIQTDLSAVIPRITEDFDLVIHAAGKAHNVPVTDAQKRAFYKVNVNGTKNLLDGLSQRSTLPKSFVFISSVAVYGRETGIGISEDAPLSARDPYGNSKIQAELLVQEWCIQKGIVCTILRLPLLIGINPPGNLATMIKGIKKGYYFNIAGGKARKSMVLAADVAKIIPLASKVGGIFNLTDRTNPSFSDLSLLIAQRLNKVPPFNLPLTLAKVVAIMGDLIGPKAPFNSEKLNKIISDLTFSDDKAVLTFGWNPTPVLKGFKID